MTYRIGKDLDERQIASLHRQQLWMQTNEVEIQSRLKAELSEKIDDETDVVGTLYDAIGMPPPTEDYPDEACEFAELVFEWLQKQAAR